MKSGVLQSHVLVERLEELSDLSLGWHDGAGRALDKTKLAFISQRLGGRYPEKISLPVIAPTLEGNLLLEWNFPGDPSVDINLENLHAEFHMFRAGTQDMEMEFDLNEDAGWTHLFDFLKHILG